MGKAILVAAALLLVGALGAGAFLLYQGGVVSRPTLDERRDEPDGGTTAQQRSGGTYKKYGPAPTGRPPPPGTSSGPSAPRDDPKGPAPRPP